MIDTLIYLISIVFVFVFLPNEGLRFWLEILMLLWLLICICLLNLSGEAILALLSNSQNPTHDNFKFNLTVIIAFSAFTSKRDFTDDEVPGIHKMYSMTVAIHLNWKIRNHFFFRDGWIFPHNDLRDITCTVYICTLATVRMQFGINLNNFC